MFVSVVCGNHLVGSEFSDGMRTHTHFYPLEKPLEANLKELTTTSAFFLDSIL